MKMSYEVFSHMDLKNRVQYKVAQSQLLLKARILLLKPSLELAKPVRFQLAH